ncbi:MAG: ribulose-phosphate 3-epimerase [Acidobacteriota bacterium]
MSVKLAPSILAADFARLADEIGRVEAAGADLIHVDVMDGHFVPNITLGPPIVAAIKAVATRPLDVHLMIADPDRYLDAFVKAGAALVTVHAEVLPHLHRTLTRIRELGAKAGVAINPSTGVHQIADVIDQIDYLLVMSVNPGFTGQTFIAHSTTKVAQARALFTQAGSSADIEVDGGVDAWNARALTEAGATMLVAGAAIFHSPDPAAAMANLRRAAEGGR